MQEIWQRIDSWLQQNAPEIFSDLLPAASDEQFSQVEETIQCELPQSIKEFYLIHNGTRGGGPPLMGKWRLLNLDTVCREWSIQNELLADGVFDDEECEPDEPVQPVWWDNRWIPVASNDSGDLICLDLNPPEDGTFGQLIRYWHNDPARTVIAKSFTDWLTQFLNDLENGIYRIEDGWLLKG